MVKTQARQSGLLNAPGGGSGAPHKMCCYLPVLAHTSIVHSKFHTLLAIWLISAHAKRFHMFWKL